MIFVNHNFISSMIELRRKNQLLTSRKLKMLRQINTVVCKIRTKSSMHLVLNILTSVVVRQLTNLLFTALYNTK